MSRFTGSINKKSRRLGISLREDGKEFAKGKKRTTAPGQHGAKKRKDSSYGLQLQERQKIRGIYGLNTKPLKKVYEKALKMEGLTGTNLLIILESRLDNIVYRMGLATTRPAARQLVNHNHVLVNGKKANIASYQVQVGDVISLKEGLRSNPKVLESFELNLSTLPFVEFDKKTFSGKYLRHPERHELNQEVNETLFIESFGRA